MLPMKKFYYVANIRLPTEKAHGIQIMKMCEAFAELGQEVELIVPQRATPIKEDPFIYYGVKNIFRITKLPTVDLIRFGKLGFWIQAVTFAEAASWYLLLKKGIFYTRDELMALFLKMMNKKVMWEVHMGQMNFFAQILLKLQTPMIVITQGLKELYTKSGGRESSIMVAHDAVNLGDFKVLPDEDMLRKELKLPEHSFIVAYIGKYKTLGHTKGVEAIIQPFKKLHDIHSESFLLFVGLEKGEIEELEALIVKEGISKDSYKIVGHVQQKEAIKYMKASHLLLMMYPPTTHYALYMSPLKLFEYMASGTPILVSDLPSLREVVNEDEAFLFDPKDSSDFERKLLYIAEHQGEAKEKARQAASVVQRYTWGERARQILTFIT
jgi:glycosyltransferase involved in cell wall biosynthesis